MTEPERWMICKCGEDMEDNGSPETTVCPSCKRWGCWTPEVHCPKCGDDVVTGPDGINTDDAVLQCTNVNCGWHEYETGEAL